MTTKDAVPVVSTERRATGATSQTRRAAAGSVAGTMLEYYDFAIYGLAAALVFGPVFFPAVSPTVGLLSSFATFGVGFLARPLGGIVFGHLGDRIGRKNVLVATLITMGTSTVLIGCLPGFDTWGYWAPALLVVLRLLQGLAFGGEWGGAVLIVAEHADPRRRGFYSALPNAGLAAGLILGNLAFLAVSALDTAALQSWGWRVPFWAGAVLVVVGLLIRRNTEESPEFQSNKDRNEVPKAPLVEVLRTHPLHVLLAACIVAGISASAYLTITYSLGFAKEVGVPSWLPLTGVLVSASLHLVWVPGAGALSDRLGRIPVFVTGALGLAVMGLLFFPMLSSGSVVLVLLAYVLLYGVAYPLPQAVYPVLLIESFDTRLAYSGISLGQQLGNVIGGFTPFLATLVVSQVGANFLGVCICVGMLISAAAAWTIVRLPRPAAAGTR